MTRTVEHCYLRPYFVGFHDVTVLGGSVVLHETLWRAAALFAACVLAAAAFPAARAQAQEAAEGTECFVSAYYRRVVTVPGFNRIAITVTLPKVTIDPVRDRSDGFHIYLGGTSLGPGGSEVDAGLAWEITRNRWGEIDYVNRAWRPMFRTSSPAAYINAPAVADYYWYPGEEVTLTFRVVEDGWVTLSVEGAGKSFTFDPVRANGFNLRGEQLLKWVVSLDQSGRERLGPLPTRARVEGAHVRDVRLWTPEGEMVVLTDALVHKPRTCIMPGPEPFTIEYRTKYADEVISIRGLQQ